jgi:arylsulfatase A-like enzyme
MEAGAGKGERKFAANSSRKLSSRTPRGARKQVPPMSVPRILPALIASLFAAFSAWAAEVPFVAKGEHVVLVVWDGMRPDFIRADTTPVLHALATRGTFFGNNHSVYITSTEVNGTAIATGCHPGRNGILANVEFRPDIHPLHPIATEHPQSCRRGDEVREGKYVRVPTLAEIVQRAGHRTAIAGTKPVALLHDRGLDRAASQGSTVVYAGKANPPAALAPIIEALGKFPPYPDVETLEPNTAQNAWTARALTEQLWRDGVPKFSTLWLGDPDYTQHLTMPGSPSALAAMAACDAALGTIVTTLRAKGVLEKTNIFIVSDHGFSTVEWNVDLSGALKKAGFTTVRAYTKEPQPGQILQVATGGSTAFYVPGRDPEVVGKLVTFLQSTNYAGVIFTRTALPGTFAMKDARIDSPDSPDVLLSFRWKEGKNTHGVTGLLASEGRRNNYGTHASLSRYDIHNTLVAAGPDIRAAFRDTLPTANVDVAPTILHLLGIPGADKMDGRILREALAGVEFPAPKPETKTIEVTAPAAVGTWRQYLKITTLGDHTYLDEGNSGPVPK